MDHVLPKHAPLGTQIWDEYVWGRGWYTVVSMALEVSVVLGEMIFGLMYGDSNSSSFVIGDLIGGFKQRIPFSGVILCGT